MNPVLSIDDNQSSCAIVGIADEDDPGKLGLTFVRLNHIETWFVYNQLDNRIEELDEPAAMPLELLWLAYRSGKAATAAQPPNSYTRASSGSGVSHFPSSPAIAQIGHMVQAYAAAHGQASQAAQGSSGTTAGPAMGGGGQGGVAGIATGGGGPGAPGMAMVVIGGGGGRPPVQLSQASQAELLMQMLRAMPHQVEPEALNIPTFEEPVQDEQESINQLDRELAGLDEFLNDVRGHTGGDL